eukprot:13016219-Alexandrium_andersonii.AAC.1
MARALFRSCIRDPPAHGDEKTNASPGPFSSRTTTLAELAREIAFFRDILHVVRLLARARESVLRGSQQQ